jgi:hypothetical protein
VHVLGRMALNCETIERQSLYVNQPVSRFCHPVIELTWSYLKSFDCAEMSITRRRVVEEATEVVLLLPRRSTPDSSQGSEA